MTRYAARLGISLAEAVRRCVDAQLDQDDTHPSRQERLRAALAVCGKYRDSSGETRVAREHDRHLDAAYGT
ncbi:MAG: CopG family transcriptional regulator [Acidobacteria bacterium]|nr:CopG family transcriptional regulator [Acidobacteriota bacterium]